MVGPHGTVHIVSSGLSSFRPTWWEPKWPSWDCHCIRTWRGYGFDIFIFTTYLIGLIVFLHSLLSGFNYFFMVSLVVLTEVLSLPTLWLRWRLHCLPGRNPCGHHETVAEQEGMCPLYLHKVLWVKLHQVCVMDQVTPGNLCHTLHTYVKTRRRQLEHCQQWLCVISSYCLHYWTVCS